MADREKKVWLHSSTTGEGEEVEKHQERRRLPRLAGTGLCRAYKACQGISTFPRRIRAVGEEFKAGQGWLSPVLGEPPGPWEERDRTEGVRGRWGCLCGAGIVWSRRGMRRLRQGNVKDRGEGVGGGVRGGRGSWSAVEVKGKRECCPGIWMGKDRD